VHAIEAADAEEEEEVMPKPSKFDQAHRAEGVMSGEHTKKVPLCEDVPDRTVTISKGLDEVEEARLIQFLRNNQDVFAWSSLDLRGVSREIMEHFLWVDPKVKPRKQRLWTMFEDRKKEAQGEVQKLLMRVSFAKYNTPSGWLTWSWSQRKMAVGGCASTS